MIITKRKFLAFSLVVATNLSLGLPFAQPILARPEQNNIAVFDEQIGDRPYQVTRVLIKARPEQVWQIITDYSGAPNIFASLKKCQVVLDKGSTKIVHYCLRPSGVLATFEYDLELKEQPNKLLEWRRVAGDFKALQGYWKLDAAECGRSTIVTYASYVNGGFLMPQALIRRQSRIDLPAVMAALKDRSERTMNIASHGTHSANQ